MVRRQVQFEESQLAALQQEAARAHVSFAEVVRRAVDGYLEVRRGARMTGRRQRILVGAWRGEESVTF